MEDGLTGYTCNCFPGWTSNDNLEGQEDCAVNIDDCPSTNVDIWISQGDSSAQPWYRFYTNANCNSNSEVSDPTKLQAYTTYTFKRCSSATSHPFAIQIGGSWTADLISNSALTLNVENPGTQFSWKCTQHGGMNGIFTAQDAGCATWIAVYTEHSYTCDCAGTG